MQDRLEERGIEMLTFGKLVIDACYEGIVPVWHGRLGRDVVDCRAEGAVRRWKVAHEGRASRADP